MTDYKMFRNYLDPILNRQIAETPLLGLASYMSFMAVRSLVREIVSEPETIERWLRFACAFVYGKRQALDTAGIAELCLALAEHLEHPEVTHFTLYDWFDICTQTDRLWYKCVPIQLVSIPEISRENSEVDLV